MCLTNPDALEGACKVEIDPCKKSVPNIMTYVTARLASMRVDSCTREFKECLTSEDRCGADYTQCVGLDTDTIVEMCPVDKLPGCKYDPNGVDNKDYDVYKNLEKIATGIFLNIDNNLLSACQKAVQSKVLEVCGSLSECDAFDDDNLIGTDSLISSTNANGNTVIEGLMNIGALKLKEDNNTYTINYADVSNNTKPGIKAAINSIENKALQKVNVLNSDLTITRCISGRGDGWRDWRYKTAGSGDNQGTGDSVGFPNLLNSYTQMIFNSALDKAKSNYSAKYDEMVAAALKAQSDDEKRMICIAMAYSPDSLECDSEGVCVTKDNGSLSELLEGMYSSDTDSGLTDGGYKLVIKQADLTKKLELMSKNKGSIVVKNGYDEMISMVTTEAYYDASSGTCTITTTTTQCETMKENLRETDKVKDIKFENGTQKKYVCDDCKFDTMCAEYAAPIINKTEIKI
jgi:ribosomal protein L23